MRKKLLFLFLIAAYTSSAQVETSVYFDFDSYSLSTKTKDILDTLASRKIVSINIFGHCDQLGGKLYNYALSDRRANAVKEYLVSKGLAAENIKLIKGYGEDQPVIEKLDESSRQANRRVTIVTVYSSPAREAQLKKTPRDKPVVQTRPTPVKPKEKLVDEIKDTSTKAGQNIILKNINFYGGSHRFLPMSYKSLDELLEAMQKIPTLVIEIQGHICCQDNERDGMDNDTGEPFLSYNRAEAVYYFLLRNGIDKSRMTYKGFGHKYPIYDVELTEAERTANRRVEIKIIKK